MYSMVIGDGLVLHLVHTVMLGGQECEELYCEEMLLHLACVVTMVGVRLSALYLGSVVTVDGVRLSALYLACVVTVDRVRLSVLYAVCTVLSLCCSVLCHRLPGSSQTDGTYPAYTPCHGGMWGTHWTLHGIVQDKFA